MPQEAVEVRLARQTLEVAPDDGVGFCQLRYAFLRRALALSPHVVDETLPVKRCANDARGVFERGKLRRVDCAPLACIVKAYDADELAGDEDWYDGLGLRADALEPCYPGIGDRRITLVEADTAAGAQLGGHGGELTL